MALPRRMGPRGSEVWQSMLDAAEQVLRDQGYGALTSRSVAEAIGVKQRLIYYYFQTMDELIVETFRRLAARDLERLKEAVASGMSPQDIWQHGIDNADTKLSAEFVALANRVEPLRLEVKAYIQESRQVIADALLKLPAADARDGRLQAVVAAFFATSSAIALHREAALGIDMGHAEVMAAIGQFLDRRTENA